ncbi:OpgC domain-containing protein [Methylibium petroleiphilum]|uniref:OpgC domain-containing protein n=1 Tax=Methylibium petroleiphilum TaxID=105560 RepID=UPI001AC6B558|nr:OpgC domain-containing protein [Methylibium petroleiphilum]MBN9205853.1 OpgC domain-containing protein [Methylibium petroleiphilum]
MTYARSALAHSTMPPEDRRDTSIDILRGLALLTILINHLSLFCIALGYTGAVVPTLTHFGYSSAAELFFLVSGYLIGYVYGPWRPEYRWRTCAIRLWMRALQLYLVSLLLYAGVVSIAGAFTADQLERLYIEPVVREPARAFWDFVKMQHSPPLLDILFVYAIFLIAAPTFVALLKFFPIGAMALPIGLSILPHLVPDFGFFARAYGDTTPRGLWNLFSWSLLFFGAMAAGNDRLLPRLRLRAAGHLRTTWLVALGILIAFTILYVIDSRTAWLDPYFQRMPGTDKALLGPVRLLHMGAVVAAFMTTLWTFPRLAESVPGRLLQITGAQPLSVFSAGVGLNYVGAALFVHFGGTGSTYACVMVMAVSATLALAGALRYRRSGNSMRPEPLHSNPDLRRR